MPRCVTNYRVSPTLFLSLWSTSKVVLVGDTRLRFMRSAPKAWAYVWFAPSLATTSLRAGNPVGTADVDKRALVTIKLRVKGGRKTTVTLKTKTWKTRIHSSGQIVRTRQKRAGGDVRFALNLLFAHTAKSPRQIYEVIKPRVYFWKWFFAERSIIFYALIC